MASRSALINVMHKAATAASRRMLRDFGEVENLQVSRKGPADFVSRADTNAEHVIKAELQKARPDWGFIMEESGVIAGADADAPVWIIDPLDGTSNFLHGIPHFAISIAVKDKGKITAALVFDPLRHEYFFAEAGQGAYINDRRLRVSGRRRMAEALFATGIPFLGRGDAAAHEKFGRELQTVMAVSAGVRRFGSAALDLAYVAAGRYDGYWERGLSSWDIAAGILLVREAGGFVSDFASRDRALDSGDVVAANPTIHAELLKTLKAANNDTA
jgi:myo-inositol-1(or 4)-monophosphatase